MTTQVVTRSPDVAALVERLRPVIEAYRDEGEVSRDVPAAIFDELKRSGAFKFWTPRVLGGDQAGFTDGLCLFEDLAALDASTSWVLGNALSVVLNAGTRDAAVIEEVFGDPSVVFAGAAFPPGTATRVDGGYCVTAQWAFNSGCSRADWVIGFAMLAEDGQPKLSSAGQPQMIGITMPRSEAQILDTWKTLGMRGTGSHDVRLVDHFVPDGRAAIVDPAAPRDPRFAGAMYRLGFPLNPLIIGAVAVGIARAAVADGIELAATKTPAWMPVTLADRSSVQFWLARARARVDAARTFIHATASDSLAHLDQHDALDSAHRIAAVLAGSHAIEASTEAVDLVQRVAGTSGVRTEGRFQQYFRDIHTLNQHAFGSENRYETAGQMLLGRSPDLAWVLA